MVLSTLFRTLWIGTECRKQTPRIFGWSAKIPAIGAPILMKNDCINGVFVLLSPMLHHLWRLVDSPTRSFSLRKFLIDFIAVNMQLSLLITFPPQARLVKDRYYISFHFLLPIWYPLLLREPFISFWEGKAKKGKYRSVGKWEQKNHHIFDNLTFYSKKNAFVHW